MCKYFAEYDVYDMTWVLTDGYAEWREFYHEIEINDLFNLIELNKFSIIELELKKKKESDKCIHKVCNDSSF